ncbi:MAG: DNA translocase FtsK [Bacteroidales bacterium]
MAKKANSFKNSGTKSAKSTTGGKKGKSFGSSVKSFLKDERFHKTLGLFMVLFSVVLFFAFTSYFFTWQSDDSLKPGDQARNWIGTIGRAMSEQFIKQWFGIAAYGFVFLIFIYGIKLLIKTSLFPLWKSTRITLLGMIWLSLSLGFIWGNSDTFSILGGGFGAYYAEMLSGILGKIGAGLLLLFIFLTYLIINYNLSFGFLNSIHLPKKKGVKKENNLKSTPKEDLYNTVEYSVDDDEDSEQENSPPDLDNESEEDRPNQMIVVEPGAEKEENADDKEKKESDIELTIEQPSGETLLDENGVENGGEMDHHTIDEPFDPTLDLPHYKLPPLDMLELHGSDEVKVEKDELERNKNRIVETLDNYSIQIQKIKATIGPTVTLYEIIPAPGIRISKIKNLEDDIALSLAAFGIRIIAPIPGKGTIGIEVPNQNPDIVSMRSVLSSDKFQHTKYELPFGMGKTISNESFVADLTKMPHLLMAGATGQGKSVGLNAIISSLLYRKHPAELKFVMVDPKKVELTLYSKIERHFLAKLPDSEEAIITDTRKVVRTLNSLGIEMDNRYELLKDAQVRNIKEYNVKFKNRKLNPLHGHRFLPYIVLVIDEFADLIMTAGKEIEVPITRLAQLARAVGIHLIIATQRPSVNIITGSIKANFPARVAFRVISKIDSRTILDTGGADQLIGRGDMLLSTGNDLLRLQCAFIDTPEIDRITEYIGSQRAYADAYHLPDFQDEDSKGIEDFDPSERDELFEDAARIIVQTQQGSTSLLQRKLKLGYNRAGRIIDQLEAAGIVGPFEGSKARDVKVANEVALEQYLKDLDQK